MVRKSKEAPANLGRNARLLAATVRRLRQEAGFSQEELAEKAGIRQAMVSEIEREEANPTLESLTRLADALLVDLSALFRGQAGK